MRYATFSLPSDPALRWGAVRGDRIIEITSAPSLLGLIRQGSDAWRRTADAVAASTADGHPLTDIRWHSPIPRPLKNIFCLGLNYAAHALESARARGREPQLPAAPVFFTKAPTTMNGPFDEIPVERSVTNQVDWEVELGVIIGTTGKNISRSKALEHVFGYTAINDVSARELQATHMQWFKGKSLDGTCPMGPVIVTADEFGDPQTKRVQCRVNGVLKQDGHTSDMIFPVDITIAWLSKGLTLEAGDIIATGTPAGVGIGRTPPEFLSNGDIVETEIEDVGTLRNTIWDMK
jgi:2-keto-4-pentenoate hydratase/2-oxohepta-3-ene-1,7-dioic acid hydratase in catechol pathway